MGRTDGCGIGGGTEANYLCCVGMWAKNGKDWDKEAGIQGCIGEDDGNG